MTKTADNNDKLRFIISISLLFALVSQPCQAQSGADGFPPAIMSGSVWQGLLLALFFFSIAGAMPLCSFLGSTGDKRYCALSLTALCAGVFSLSCAGLSSVWGDTPVLWQLLAMSSLYVSPAGICTFVAKSFPKEARLCFLPYLGRLYMPFALVALIAVVTNLVSVETTLKLFCFVLAVNLSALVFVLQRAARTGKLEAETIMGGIIILLVSGVTANLNYALRTSVPLELTPLWGVLAFAGCLIIALKQAKKNRRMTENKKHRPELGERSPSPQLAATVPATNFPFNDPREEKLQGELQGLKTSLSSFTHELNTPLGTGILAATQLSTETDELYELFRDGELRKSDLEKHLRSYKEAAGIITTNLQNASNIVRHYRSEIAGKAPLDRQTFSVQKHIEQVLAALRPRVSEAGHELHFACIEDVTIKSYPHMFTQIINNLVVNSLTHAYPPNAHGNLFLTVNTVDSLLELKYSDDGKGIAEAIIPKIFEPHFTTNRAGGNTGLGLSVVHNLVTEHLKGTIQCHSLPGKCTIFLIRIPIERS